MTTLELKLDLPDDFAREAQAAGLLSPEAIEARLRERMRKRRSNRLFDTMDQLSTLTPPITEVEIAAEIQAARTERRNLNAHRR